MLDAARLVFVAQGYHSAAMDDIAVGAGVSKPVLYQHFPSKLELYLALLAESAQDMVQRVRQALDGTEDNQDRTRRAVRAYFTYVADDAQAYRLIFESDLRGESSVETVVERATADCVEAITATITADTGVDPQRARLLAAGMVGLSQVSARWWVAQGGGVPVDEAVELISTLAWRGISRFPMHG
ncbi:TetR family transcriptional regulator [Nakamurella endophytica]|uniref:TetR family transcriptional regulator n=1 Tax=Nakamurella endophytica TaxID=1748367 RepID=A0A917TCI1_9ACTN|nr:TetR family transcriptional regulator [Nakamurella endophytica]